MNSIMKASSFAAVFFMHGVMLAVPAGLTLAGFNWPIVAESVLLKYAGALLAACGAILYLGTLKDLTGPGRGTPAIWDPPRFLSRRGQYRFVRNPMYLAVILVVIGETLIFNRALAAVYTAALWLGFHLFVTLYEEPDLTKRFGDSYRDYCRTVPRWLP